MDINITRFVDEADPYEFSGSVAERGANAGPDTWRNAVAFAAKTPLLTTPDEIEALRQYMKGFGAWTEEEIAAWDDARCNAFFIQLISGDMREAGMDDCFVDEFDWQAYQTRAEAGQINGNIYRAGDGEIYYSLGF